MFNSELKERFISAFAYTDSVKTSCTVTFEKSSLVEEELGKDICAMNVEEAQRVVDTVGGVRGNNARVNIVYAYVRWCLWNKIPGAGDGALQTSRQSFTKIKQRMVSGPVHLQMCLDNIFEPEGAKTADNTYRCFCWFAFMGLSQNEAVTVTTDEVDFNDMVIRHNLQSYPIYRESLQTLKNCATMTEFVVPHYGTDVRIKPRADGKEMLRGTYGAQSIDTLRSILSNKRKDKFNQGIEVSKFTYNTLTLSGAFYRIYEKERAGITPDLAPLAAATIDNRAHSFSRQTLKYKWKQTQLVNAYLEDYYAWKQVFC